MKLAKNTWFRKRSLLKGFFKKGGGFLINGLKLVYHAGCIPLHFSVLLMSIRILSFCYCMLLPFDDFFRFCFDIFYLFCFCLHLRWSLLNIEILIS